MERRYRRNSILATLPPATLNLIIINGLVWLAELVFLRFGYNLIDLLGMHYFEAPNFSFWQLITYAFLHDDSSISHLFFNMFALFMFGGQIERLWGSRRFLIFYGVCALTAALTQQIVWYFGLHEMALLSGGYATEQYVTVGASGAIFGLLLAFGMLFPNAAIFIFFIPIPIKAKYFVVFYGLIELLLGIKGMASGVAHFAHVGGMIGGLILVLLWRKKGKISGPYN
ncbi:rhomboid family intramembrane serine protease [Porphyromonas miyakawae]|uniref:Rhomboid family intramembrane serine protease n=1 Tax=Porphyromonas miyakawae TaxID=3137470 RepID=A0ABQ0E0R6_9PORP